EALGSDPSRIRELYLRAVELNPSVPEFRRALGNLLAREGDTEALQHFAAAGRLNPRLRNLHRDFGLACLRLGKREEGLEHLRIALEQDPGDAATREMLSKGELETPA
ncbi:MAG TPA: hypothetical protein VNX25_03360, partial [Verrucomicrobiae bacterium]|nr:hypothetical protein [Verrucomicrobiae bacterium]